MKSNVFGLSLEPPTNPNIFSIAKIEDKMESMIIDIRDLESVKKVISKVQPDIIIHMAAQPLVSIGYSDPVTTYSTNVMGTVNILEAIRNTNSVHSFLNVTTDKVYKNNEWYWGYREDDPLNGFDPYSNSKSCSELVTSCYINSYFDKKVPISTARAGNVIGGGDFSDNRIIPDCVRAAIAEKTMVLYNPFSTRPYQHVLEPLFAYLLIVAKQYEDHSYSDTYNVGPDDSSTINNEELVKLFKINWGPNFNYTMPSSKKNYHEANLLKLDCSKIKSTLGWKPILSITEAISKTVEWYKVWYEGKNCIKVMDKQIKDYCNDFINACKGYDGQ